MDCSWLLEDVEDSPNSEADSEEAESEVETRLYSIIHHNDLSQPLDPELAKHYSVSCADNGDVVVTLNDSLEHIKSEEVKMVDYVIENKESKDELDGSVVEVPQDEVVIISENIVQNPHRRFRYSDVNLDDFEPDEMNNVQVRKEPETNRTTNVIEYFNFNRNSFKKKNKKFNNLVIPNKHNFPDWKADANLSFISIGTNLSPEAEMVERIFCALKKVNPDEKRKMLHSFAFYLYKRKIKASKRKERVKRKKAMKHNESKVDTTLDLSQEKHLNSFVNIPKTPIVDLEKHKAQAMFTNNTPNHKNKERTNGCITLNITPFRPDPQVVDLVSEKEGNFQVHHKEPRSNSSRKLSESHIPTKWTKEMIKYYIKPSKRKMEMDLNQIIENMEKTTIAEDWWLDPRDRAGFYQRTPQGKQAGRKCANCHERGHFIRECPKPKKIPSCSLCGEYFHSDYSCPNKICLKCGVYTNSEAYSGECNTCYYSTFDYNLMCDLCGQSSHRSTVCPDLWRSFHATTEGEKKIPQKVTENKRKCCSNCARKGHFSHNCPFLVYAGQQVSPFVSNYASTPSNTGTAEIVISDHYSDIVDNTEADNFLQNLSNLTNAEIICNQDENDRSYVFRISGTFEQCKRVKTEIEGYVNTKKRKRQEHLPKRKRQRIR